MAVAFDANATASVHSTSATSITSSNLTVGSGSNRALIAQLSFDTPGISSLTVNWDQLGTPVALTQIKTGTNVIARGDLWGLVAPVSGAKQLKAAWTTASEVFMNQFSVTGADQTGGATTFAHSMSATGNNSTPSVTITSAVGNMTVDVATTDLGSIATPTQTQTYAPGGGSNINSGGSRAAGAATVTHAWASVAGDWVSVGCEIAVAVATAALTGTATGSITEADVVAGGKTVILTLTNDTYVAAAGAVDITVVGTPQSGTASGTTQVTLTFDVALAQGDVVIVWGGHHNGAGSSVTPVTGGYTAIVNDTSSNPFFGVFYKVMGASPDSTVVMPADGTSNNAAAYGCIALRNVDAVVQDATATTAGPTASTNPDGAAIVTGTDNAMVIVCAVSTSNDSAPGTVTNYTVFSSAGLNVSGTDASCSGARRVIATAGTNENPPAWSAWTTGTWKTATLAIRRLQTTPFADARADMRDGLDSAQSEAAGWDAKVKPNIPLANIVRTSDTVCTVTLQAQSDYDITAQETITATVPASIVSGGAQIVAAPTFTVDVSGGGGGRTTKNIRAFPLGMDLGMGLGIGGLQ